jgi:hypothetical protein
VSPISDLGQLRIDRLVRRPLPFRHPNPNLRLTCWSRQSFCSSAWVWAWGESPCGLMKPAASLSSIERAALS